MKREDSQTYIGDDSLPFLRQVPLHVLRRQQITGNTEEQQVLKCVTYIQVSLSFKSVCVFYRMIVFRLGGVGLQSISSANYDQHTGTRLFTAHKLTQTQLWEMLPSCKRLGCVCVSVSGTTDR